MFDCCVDSCKSQRLHWLWIVHNLVVRLTLDESDPLTHKNFWNLQGPYQIYRNHKPSHALHYQRSWIHLSIIEVWHVIFQILKCCISLNQHYPNMGAKSSTKRTWKQSRPEERAINGNLWLFFQLLTSCTDTHAWNPHWSLFIFHGLLYGIYFLDLYRALLPPPHLCKPSKTIFITAHIGHVKGQEQLFFACRIPT